MTAGKTKKNKPVTTFDGYINDRGGEVINLTNPAYGAKGDTAVSANGGNIAALSTTFAQTAYAFVAADLGKVVTVQGAGLAGAVLTTRIAAVVSATTATLADPAATTVTSAGFSFGTDDTQAIIKAIQAAGLSTRLFAPAGIYTIRGSSNNGDTLGGNQIHVDTRGGLTGQGGRYDPTIPESRANTIFLCADATAGFIFMGEGRHEGFLVDGNNIATSPIKSAPLADSGVLDASDEPVPTGGVHPETPRLIAPGTGAHYSIFWDVWVTRSAENGWWIFGSQNVAFHDCGVTDCAKDGIYFDLGTGGHDFFNFYERGSLRYGIRADSMSPGGGFIYRTGDVNFYGGTLDSHPTRRGVSKIFQRTDMEWGYYDMDIVGDNLSGPAIDWNQTLNEMNLIERCRIWATPKGTNPGNACIQISGVSDRNGRQDLFVKTYGCSFMSGDHSVYITEHSGFDQYFSRGWMLDATTYGPATNGFVDIDGTVAHATLPGPDPILIGRTGEWQTADLDPAWTGTVRYRVMGEGWVQLQGKAVSATGAAGKMFILPSGYRPRDGSPLGFLVAVGDAAESTFGSGRISVENGAVTNANAGAVSFTPFAGTGPFTGGTVVYLDGVTIAARNTTGPLW